MSHIVRKVLPSELIKYRTHLLALDAESRSLRFGITMNDYMINSICDGFEKDPEHHILFCIEDDNLDFVAMGHIATSDSMELAFSVLKEHQGRGMGDALMNRCIQWCRTHGILKGCMVCLSHNRAIRHLCTKNGIHFTTEHGETSANVELDQPGPSTYMQEATDSSLAILDYMGKRAVLPWTFVTKLTS